MEKKYYYGHAVSDEGIARGYVDYACFAASFPHILANDLMQNAAKHGAYFDLCQGNELNEYGEVIEVFQWYIVPEYALDFLRQNDEIVYYSPDLDIYLWGVTHWGTSWDYVLTDIKIDW